MFEARVYESQHHGMFELGQFETEELALKCVDDFNAAIRYLQELRRTLDKEYETVDAWEQVVEVYENAEEAFSLHFGIHWVWVNRHPAHLRDRTAKTSYQPIKWDKE